MADREPMGTDGRLNAVTPSTKPLDDHAQHDRWLVVRAASHDTDLTAAETADARALLDRCAECATLSADITTIARATAESIVPARPRDFRLTPAQAAGAKGSFLERLGTWLSTPRGTFVRPLAGATLAIGIVLVAVGPSIRPPLAQPDAPSAEAGAPAASANANATATATDDAAPMAGTGPAASPDDPGAMEHLTLLADASPEADRSAYSPVPSDGGDAALASKATPDPQVADVQAFPGTTAEPGGNQDTSIGAARAPTSDDTSLALTLLGIVLVGTGILVLLLTWLARRMTRHEPLS